MKGNMFYVRPSPFASMVIIIFLVVFLIVGVFFFDLPDEPIAIIFKFVWTLMCISGIVYATINLRSFSKSEGNNLPLSTSDVISTAESEQGKDDFEVRLRKLESLRKDGFITEEEYRRKRKEIMKGK